MHPSVNVDIDHQNVGRRDFRSAKKFERRKDWRHHIHRGPQASSKKWPNPAQSFDDPIYGTPSREFLMRPFKCSCGYRMSPTQRKGTGDVYWRNTSTTDFSKVPMYVEVTSMVTAALSAGMMYYFDKHIHQNGNSLINVGTEPVNPIYAELHPPNNKKSYANS